MEPSWWLVVVGVFAGAALGVTVMGLLRATVASASVDELEENARVLQNRVLQNRGVLEGRMPLGPRPPGRELHPPPERRTTTPPPSIEATPDYRAASEELSAPPIAPQGPFGTECPCSLHHDGPCPPSAAGRAP